MASPDTDQLMDGLFNYLGGMSKLFLEKINVIMTLTGGGGEGGG